MNVLYHANVGMTLMLLETPNITKIKDIPNYFTFIRNIICRICEEISTILTLYGDKITKYKCVCFFQ